LFQVANTFLIKKVPNYLTSSEDDLVKYQFKLSINKEKFDISEVRFVWTEYNVSLKVVEVADDFIKIKSSRIALKKGKCTLFLPKSVTGIQITDQMLEAYG
jgi:hypothetical protein